MKTTEPTFLIATCILGLAATIVAYGQTPKPTGPPLKWYGVDQIDFREGIPDDLSIVDIQGENPIVRRAETQTASAGSPNPNYAGRDAAVRVCKAVVVDGTDRKAGGAVEVVLRADWGRNWTAPGPLEPGRYLVAGMRPRNGRLPEFDTVSDGTPFVQAERADEVFGLVIFPTKASAISCASDPVERIMESLVQALPGASRTNMERITNFLKDSPLPADDRSATVRTKTPVGWEKSLYDLARQTADPYMRARSLEALMWHHVENMEGEFATALMDCAGDPDAFEVRPPYRGLGPDFSYIGAAAFGLGDLDYWTRSPYDHDRAAQVALNAKNDNIRYYLISQVLWAPNPGDWAEFVKLLREPPKPYWQDMLVRVFARWRGKKPTPKIEYGVVDGVRKITNMPELIEFYSKEYPDVRP
jgi:hypothetical protein